jgi:UDP-hydrolysing UDP-N-acetyl-D-glucosamine 2-epimerase
MKIAVVTGTRAEFGLLSGLMTLIDDSPKLDLQVVVTGTHLLPEFGHTVDAIRGAGFQIAAEVRAITHANTGADVGRQVGAGTSEFTDTFNSLSPDVAVLLGDRYEMLAAAIAALFLEIPIVHIHGGEVTHGAFDDTIRHAITKFSSVHCVAHADYAARVIQLGEHPENVHVVGALGVDQLSGTPLKNREQLEQHLGLELRDPLFLVTYHPVTSGESDSLAEVSALVLALEALPDPTVIVTMPNADPDHQIIADALREAVNRHSGRWIFSESLGQVNCWSVMALATAVVGNSSSGILEAPSFSTPTVNIGPRQDGRIFAESVVSCEPGEASILRALQQSMSKEFRDSLGAVTNPLGGPGAAKRILGVLENLSPGNLEAKVFYDQPGSQAKADRDS